MLEQILIIVLSLLVVILSALIIVRRVKDRKKVVLPPDAINDLLNSFQENIKNGKIPDIAGSISNILIKHLKCDKIVFLKRKHQGLELNYFYGIRNFDRREFDVSLPITHQRRLKLYDRIHSISRLKSVIDQNKIDRFTEFGFKYFFPVFLRDNLFGLYMINTVLPSRNPSLNLLATTLAFNLSTAYQLGLHENKIKKYESHINYLKNEKNGKNAKNSSDSKIANGDNGEEYSRLLKLRNCRQLVPELVNRLKKEGNFSRLGFYVRTNYADLKYLSSGWKTGNEIEKVITENYDIILKAASSENIISVAEDNPGEEKLQKVFERLKKHRIEKIASIKWNSNNKALLVFNSIDSSDDIKTSLRNFQTFALPLVDNVSRFERAEEISYTDGLTGMYNFRYFKKRLWEEVQRAKRYGRNLALMIFDVDDLKVINDRHGHLAGDALIKSFGQTLVRSVRSNDVVSRYGGDEFCAIMPDTNRDEVSQFAHRIIEKISTGQTRWEWADKKMEYTVSMGGAVYPADAESVEDLIHAADMALLKAKQTGRNRAMIYSPEIDIDN